MAGIDYTELYKLQDQVLTTVFAVEKEFYLTGGTCLSRFYHEKRYSDDLDFFAQNSPRFSFAVRSIKSALAADFSTIIEVETKNFIRFRINELLQVDFVNDVSSRYGDVVNTPQGYLIDNIGNILSNKLTAVIGRDNPKDIFDIYLISMYNSFSWKDILNSAREKAWFTTDELAARLKTFPVNLFQSIKIIDFHFLDHFTRDFPLLINEIIEESHHVKLEGITDNDII